MKWDLDLERGILQGVRKGEEDFKGGFLGVRKKKKLAKGNLEREIPKRNLEREILKRDIEIMVRREIPVRNSSQRCFVN